MTLKDSTKSLGARLRWYWWLLIGLGTLYGVHSYITAPHDNPTPTKRIFVSGTFPYDKEWELQIYSTYYTKNPTCKQMARAFFFFPQAEVTRNAFRSTPVIRDEGTRYHFEVFEDAIRPGFCEWTLQFVHFRIMHESKEIAGSAMLGLNRRYNVIRYACRKVVSTYYRTPNRTPVEEVGFACLERDNHWKDPTTSDNQVDFVWEEEK